MIVNYRLAPCGRIPGQESHTDPLSGRPVEQTNDIKALVRAARADGHCLNNMVGVIGGSSGGTHALSVALDKTPSAGWPNWGPGDRANAAVGLSGAYDFSDRDEPGYEPLTQFIRSIENYTNTCVRVDPAGPTDQKRFSPVSFVTSDAKPVYIVNTEEDSMPWHQIIDMQCALQTAGAINYKVWTIPGIDLHSFAYWTTPICGTNPCNTSIKVRDRVIDFLDDHLKDPP